MLTYLTLGNRRRVLGDLRDEDTKEVIFVPLAERHHQDPEHLTDLLAASAKRKDLRLRIDAWTSPRIVGFERSERPEGAIAIRLFLDEGDEAGAVPE